MRQGGIDTTVKSSVGVFKEFAPQWDWVMSHKAGTLSDEGYTALYLPVLDQAFEGWRQLYNGSSNTVACYCNDGKFCHTYILALYASVRWPHLFEDHTRSKEVLKQSVVTQVLQHIATKYK